MERLQMEEDDGGGTEALVKRFLNALRRFKWLILAITVLGTGGSVVATRFIPPEYRVQATIWIGNGAGRTGPIQAPNLLSGLAWLELINSFPVRDPVVRKLKLYLSPEHSADSVAFRNFDLDDQFFPGRYLLKVDAQGRAWTLEYEGGPAVDAGVVGDSIGRARGFRWVADKEWMTPDHGIAFSLITPREASTAMNLNPRMSGDEGNFIHLNMSGVDAHRTANTVNAIAEQFLTVAADLKKQKLTEFSNALHEQMTQQEVALREAEQALEGYRVNTITLPNETSAPVASGLTLTQPTVLGNYFQLRQQLEVLKQDRRAIEDVLGRTEQKELTVDAFQTIPSVRNAPDLVGVLNDVRTLTAQLRVEQQTYTAEHPTVKTLNARLDTLRLSVIPTYARALIKQLLIQEQMLQDRIDASDRELKSIPVRTSTEARLRREADAAQALFRTLQNRYEEAKLAEMSAVPDVSLLSPAVAPARPTKNTAPRLILMGFGASLAAALVLAILLDRIDSRFRYPEQVTQDLRLSILGAVPVIRNQRGNGLRSPDETAQIVEAFRSIRLNLAHSSQDGAIAVTITSPSPGDGKSLISSNLALAFAEAGYRTVLIDGDTRRGELHKTFQVDRRPGLLDYLLGATTLEGLLRPSSHALLSVIPGGTRTHRGPELLGSARMTELMAHLRGRFDAIIVDTPPLGAGIDPFVLGTVTGNMVLVLRSGETDRQLAEAKLHTVDRLPIRVLGAILNDIHTGVGAYRYYNYSYGYSAEEEGGSTGERVEALQKAT